MIAGRILAYGAEYPFDTTCPACGHKETKTINLSEVEDKEIDFSKWPKGTKVFEFKLPASKRTITYQLMTHGLERKVDDALKVAKKRAKRTGIDPELTTRMKMCILSVDGKDEQPYIDNFVDTEFLSRDAQAFRNQIKSHTPDSNMVFEFECENCGHEEVLDFPITAGFFWPSK